MVCSSGALLHNLFALCAPFPRNVQGGEDIGLDGGAGGLKWEGMGTSDF